MFDTSVMECTTSLDLDLVLLLNMCRTATWLIQHRSATTQTQIIHSYVLEQ